MRQPKRKTGAPVVVAAAGVGATVRVQRRRHQPFCTDYRRGCEQLRLRLKCSCPLLLLSLLEPQLGSPFPVQRGPPDCFLALAVAG